MAKWMVLVCLSLVSQFGSADSDFGDGFGMRIGNESFRSRFYLKGELFYMDQTGKKLLIPTSDIREWRPGIKSNKIAADWITKAKGIRDVIVRFEMVLNPDNSIKASFKQYESIEHDMAHKKEPKYGKLIREESMDIENFAPITWIAETGKDFRIVLRFTPQIDARREGQTIDKITIGGDRNNFTITDNQGYLWGYGVRFGGVISGMASHRGTFVFSYYPFKGGKEMGFAEGKQIVLNLTDKLQVTIDSQENVLPDQMRVKVYGFYNPKFKMDRPNSVWSFGQEKVEQISKEFGL